MHENSLVQELRKISTLRSLNSSLSSPMKGKNTTKEFEDYDYVQHLESRVLMKETYDKI